MPKLTLKFEDRILREVPVSSSAVTIGRLPNNAVAIDNPAVSGQHARVMVEGGQYVLEDLNSRNGTFVNNQAVTKHVLQEGDVIRIGKHTLTFYGSGAGEVTPDAAPAKPAAPMQDLGGTVFLDTKAQKELLAKAKAAAQAQAAASGEPGAAARPAAPVAVPRAAAAVPTKIGVLTVVSGSTDKKQYNLETQTTLVGKSDTALVRLKGWFKPQVAAAITRKGSAYLVTPLAGKSQVNGQPLRQGYEMKPGDVLDISGVTFQFSYQE